MGLKVYLPLAVVVFLAALSVGLLPFFIGGPVILAVIGAGALVARFDRRMSG
jgi:hypothetical protein